MERGKVEVGRMRRAAGGGGEGAGGGWEGGEGNWKKKGWEGRGRMHLTFMFLANRKCHFRLASLFSSLLLSPASLWPVARLPHLLPCISLHSRHLPSVTSPLISLHQPLPIFIWLSYDLWLSSSHFFISLSSFPSHRPSPTSRPSFVSFYSLILRFWILFTFPLLSPPYLYMQLLLFLFSLPS